jgi:mono/diheme cytochrome c family protein
LRRAGARHWLAAGVVALALGTMGAAWAANIEMPRPKPDKQRIERGRYLTIVGGCNDCHTLGYGESEGQLPERGWLTGSPVGYQGIWGTTYATNLRLSLSRMTEDLWVKYAKALETRPPMPWFNLNQWSEDDLRSFYHYVRQLGPVGKAAPHPVPPHEEPTTPTISWPLPAASPSAVGASKPAGKAGK